MFSDPVIPWHLAVPGIIIFLGFAILFIWSLAKDTAAMSASINTRNRNHAYGMARFDKSAAMFFFALILIIVGINVFYPFSVAIVGI